MRAPIPLLLASLGLWRACHGECFHPSGDVAADDYPCDPAATDSVCCAGADMGFACLNNKLCQDKTGRVVRGSCTDKDWLSPECPNFCLHNSRASHNLVPCSNVTGHDTSYCCDGMLDCCDRGVGRFDAMPSNASPTAVWLASSTRYVAVAPAPTPTTAAGGDGDDGGDDGGDGDGDGDGDGESDGADSGSSSSSSTDPGTGDGQGAAAGTSDAPPASTGPARRMSVGAQIGLGVGVGVAAILVTAGVCLWWGRRRRSREAAQHAAADADAFSSKEYGAGHPVAVATPQQYHSDPAEVQYRAGEMESPQRRHELHDRQPAAELPQFL